eukprot:scaffold1.g5823.t1
MFPFLRDVRKGSRRGWERARVLSADYGSGGVAHLHGLPEAFAAFIQARRERLERSGMWLQGWAVLWFLLKVLYLFTYDQFMAVCNEDYTMLWDFWLFGARLQEQTVWLVNAQVLRSSQHQLQSSLSAAQLLGLVGADARQYEYIFSTYRLISTPFDIAMSVVLLWRNLDHNWLGVVLTLAPAVILLAVQPWFNKLFSAGLRKASKFHASRLTFSRDALANFLPIKLYSAQPVLRRLVAGERKKEERALTGGMMSNSFQVAAQIWAPPFITQNASSWTAGGQRIRLGLARAAYAALSGKVGWLLLDDPLAGVLCRGVDPEKANLIFQRLIGRGSALKGLTRAVAVSDLALLPRFDVVVDLSDGSRSKSGEALVGAAPTAAAAPGARDAADDVPPDVGLLEDDGGLGEPELAVPGNTLHRMLGLKQSREVPRITCASAVCAASTLMAHLLVELAAWHGRTWRDDGDGGGEQMDSFSQWAHLLALMGVPAVLVLVGGLGIVMLTTESWLNRYVDGSDIYPYRLLSYLFGWLMIVVGTGVVMAQTIALIRGSTRSLNEAVSGLMDAPYAFYLSNPSSRLLARLSDDQRRVDEQLTRTFLGCMTMVALTLVSVVMAIISLPQEALLLSRVRSAQEDHLTWNDGLSHTNVWLLFASNVMVYCPIAIFGTIMAAAMLSDDSSNSSAATLVANVFMQIANLVYAVSATLSGVENQLTAVDRVRSLAELEPELAAVRRLEPGEATGGKGGGTGGGNEGGEWPSDAHCSFADATAVYHWGADPGDIDIDERSVLSLPLDRLRSAMAVVPQEPALFTGTVRFNLDVGASSHDDATLWEVLRMVVPALADCVAGLGGLDAALDPQKPAVSRGQMQLLCLVRAVLRDAPILVLDEANTSVGAATDAMMEEYVARFVAGRAGLTRLRRSLVQVSHKATGLRSRDHIVVLESGRVVEQGAPAELLELPDGRFAAMLRTLEAVSQSQLQA